MRLATTVLVVVMCLRTGQAAGPDFSKADRLIEAAIERGELPGAVLAVGRRSGVVHLKAYGRRAVLPKAEAMTVDTIFDLASLTKPIATATSVMVLVDQGKVDLGEKVSKYLPEFTGRGKEEITVGHLLLHFSGLTPDNDMKDYAEGPAKAWEKICGLGLRSAAGQKFAYSDVGYIVLGKLVERVDGRSVDRFASQQVFEPLGMKFTAYHPPAAWRERVAPTQQRAGQWMRGEVHDPRAHALGGVAGHAGLFGTAEDLAAYCQMFLNKGEAGWWQVLSPKMVKVMTQGHSPKEGDAVRSMGFDVKTGYSGPLGDRMTPLKSFGHTGFTGTCFWISPADDMYFVLLTNAVHPDGKGKVLQLRREVSTAVGEAVLGKR